MPAHFDVQTLSPIAKAFLCHSEFLEFGIYRLGMTMGP
ncbi:hypothetical protein C943_01313 [Mariniradius saccharolyticus AK6]|uniref:Uncharacterized protein n=1 Tax=Mariniradius saccharolyticus AK6 TaxID=1239962 RepID=M7Y5Q1_9BACT|nr:hypothetical protein C943_01313 [Mariniradius saccharolyticus AK6]